MRNDRLASYGLKPAHIWRWLLIFGTTPNRVSGMRQLSNSSILLFGALI
jgi:hypothetical protein